MGLLFHDGIVGIIKVMGSVPFVQTHSVFTVPKQGRVTIYVCNWYVGEHFKASRLDTTSEQNWPNGDTQSGIGLQRERAVAAPPGGTPTRSLGISCSGCSRGLPSVLS